MQGTVYRQLRILVGCVLLCGCAPERGEPQPGVLVVNEAEQTAAFVRNFNPFFELGDVRWPARHSMYEPLMIFNVITGEYVPWLATAYRWSEDSTVLRFEIRDGVLWSDGRPFTADDVVFTFQLMTTNNALDLRGLGRYLAEVRSPEPGVVEFQLVRPYVPVLQSIAQQPIVPRHIWQDVEEPVSFANESPVATGPFTEVSTFQTQAYQVDRNPHYWQAGKPQVESLRFLAFPGNEQANMALVTGDVDWAADFVPAIDRVYVAKNPQHHHYWFPLVDGTVFLYANTQTPPYDDVRVRKALSMAIDRELVVKVGMHDYTRPADATGLSDAYARYRSDDAVAAGDWVEYDVDRANALLDEAGLTRGEDGTRFSLSILVPSGFSDWVRAAQVMAHGFEAVHIDASIKTYDFNTWFDKVQTGDFGVTLGWSEVHESPHGLYRGLMSTATVEPLGTMAMENWHRFGSPEADALLAQLEQTTDPQLAQPIIDELQALFVAQAPAIPLFPGPAWGEFNTRQFVGFPDADNPYAPLTPNWAPQSLLVLTELRPRSPQP